MSPRTTVAAGLLSGAVVALAVLLAAVIFLPDPGPAAHPSSSPGPSGGVAGSGSPVASPGGGSDSPEPTVDASFGEALFYVGEPAPALAVPQVGGGAINLANLEGRPVWINFMQTTCPPCVDEFPIMNGFAADYANTGLVIIAIDIREEEGTVAAFAQSLNATFPIGLDVDGSAQRAWDAVALPVHFWIDRDGVIRAGALGGIGPDVMAENLQTILPGVDVQP
ncbi:MAG: TlpA family protein disulfide reductase [Chloroflexi bacterium]|nr:TlpA family protein disulfide reductase [Chloroflexota bacterium]